MRRLRQIGLALGVAFGVQVGVASEAHAGTVVGGQVYIDTASQVFSGALGSALARLDRIVARLEGQGIASDRVVIAGFSQGACLAVTYATLRARRWGGVIAFTGGLIGPPGPGSSWEGWPDDGSLAGTPVFLGCGDPDPHVPRQRVEETATHLESIGAFVTKRIYPGMGHTVNQDEIDAVRELLG